MRIADVVLGQSQGSLERIFCPRSNEAVQKSRHRYSSLSRRDGEPSKGNALAAALSPQLVQRGVTAFGTSDRFASQHFAVIPNSVSSGSTFQVQDRRKAITVSL